VLNGAVTALESFAEPEWDFIMSGQKDSFVVLANGDRHCLRIRTKHGLNTNQHCMYLSTLYPIRSVRDLCVLLSVLLVTWVRHQDHLTGTMFPLKQ
jgi:hypothetical protein